MFSGKSINTACVFWIPTVQVTPTERNAVLLLKLESDRLARDNEQSSKFHTPSGLSLGRTMSLWIPVAAASPPLAGGDDASAPGGTCLSGASRSSACSRSCSDGSSDWQAAVAVRMVVVNVNSIDS